MLLCGGLSLQSAWLHHEGGKEVHLWPLPFNAAVEVMQVCADLRVNRAFISGFNSASSLLVEETSRGLMIQIEKKVEVEPGCIVQRAARVIKRHAAGKKTNSPPSHCCNAHMHFLHDGAVST